MREEQAIFNLEIKKKSGLSINPDIQHSKVPSSGLETLCIFSFVSNFGLFSLHYVCIISRGQYQVVPDLLFCTRLFLASYI